MDGKIFKVVGLGINHLFLHVHVRGILILAWSLIFFYLQYKGRWIKINEIFIINFFFIKKLFVYLWCEVDRETMSF